MKINKIVRLQGGEVDLSLLEILAANINLCMEVCLLFIL